MSLGEKLQLDERQKGRVKMLLETLDTLRGLKTCKIFRKKKTASKLFDALEKP